jgi:hypothetical protein
MPADVAAPHIHLAGRILADQNRAKAGRDARARFQFGRHDGNVGDKAIRAGFSVDAFGRQHGRERLCLIRKSGSRFPAFATLASAGEARSEKTMHRRKSRR